MRYTDYTGLKLHRLTVIKRAGTKHGRPAWLCRCDCGAETIQRVSNIRIGRVRSCGCLQIEAARNTATHGLSQSREYKSWSQMKHRCSAASHEHFSKYGGRGITVDPEWMMSFEAFYRDMGPRPKGMSLDRIDINGNYTKDNCRWASPARQNRNKSTTKWVEWRGRKTTISDVAEEVGLPNAAIRNAMRYRGIEDAIEFVRERQHQMSK